ncbi:uncharacterized protein LOC133814810 [Humulus lupulus]|uniref:uncharacterized protein LOC133814810 n=1 Tax=Humulus lupulus TaxID=3486 RepID=UPI002B4092CE|nr:uncharacterized protein LOC133814810 [Humulus lupulus]
MYVDDMLVKSRIALDHVKDLAEVFSILHKFGIKLNPHKCTFGVASGKFFGLIVSACEIEENHKKIKALIEMSSPRKYKDVQHLAGTFIKGQTLADFIAKCTGMHERPKEGQPVGLVWKLYRDRSSNENSAGAGLILVSPEVNRVLSALRFGFDASNNEAEYEALIVGLQVVVELKVEGLNIYNDSQLVVNQVLGKYQAQGTKMVAYLAKTQEMLHNFKRCRHLTSSTRTKLQ